jgi:hypothetical protein
LIEDHPLRAGAVTLVLGAVVGGLLPRTDTEDRTFGAESDRLKAGARGLLRNERNRATTAAHTAAEVIGSELTSVLARVIAIAADAVADAADRAARTATDRRADP